VPGFVLVERSPAPNKPAPADVVKQAGLGILAVIPSASQPLDEANAQQKPLILTAPQHPASLATAELGKRITSFPIEAAFTLRPRDKSSA